MKNKKILIASAITACVVIAIVIIVSVSGTYALSDTCPDDYDKLSPTLCIKEQELGYYCPNGGEFNESNRTCDISLGSNSCPSNRVNMNNCISAPRYCSVGHKLENGKCKATLDSGFCNGYTISVENNWCSSSGVNGTCPDGFKYDSLNEVCIYEPCKDISSNATLTQEDNIYYCVYSKFTQPVCDNNSVLTEDETCVSTPCEKYEGTILSFDGNFCIYAPVKETPDCPYGTYVEANSRCEYHLSPNLDDEENLTNNNNTDDEETNNNDNTDDEETNNNDNTDDEETNNNDNTDDEETNNNDLNKKEEETDEKKDVVDDEREKDEIIKDKEEKIENPKTGDVLIYSILIISVIALSYGVYYFYKIKKNNNVTM